MMLSATEQETLRCHEQATLDGAMPAAARNRAGQFATPSLLAEEILRYVWQRWEPCPHPIHFLEPCVGTGSFFSALLRVFPRPSIQRATGYELDPAHAGTAERLWHGSGLTVTQGDFLQQAAPRERYNLLITNPPYVRHHHLDRSRKQRLQRLVRDRLGIRISGLAGLYCHFLLLADAWLEDGALAVWLIPSEFMDVNYGTAVKEYLTTRVRLLHLHRFCPSDVQFDDALVSSTIVIFEKAKPTGESIFSLGGSLLRPDQSVTLPLTSLRPTDKWTQYTAITATGTRPSTPPICFGDLFTIRRGLATGNNRFFILPRPEAARLELPDQFLRPILPPPRNLPAKIIESDPDGYPQLKPQLALLDCRLSESQVKKDYPALWRYLESGHAKGVHDTYLTSRRIPWYSQENRPAPPFLCTYMGRTGNGRKPFRFLWNKSQATAHNVYLLLYPKGILRQALQTDPELYAQVFAAVESLDTDNISGSGRVYGGGLYKMEPKELARISADFLVSSLGLRSRLNPFTTCALFDLL